MYGPGRLVELTVGTSRTDVNVYGDVAGVLVSVPSLTVKVKLSEPW
jgi:hypothetical protein